MKTGNSRGNRREFRGNSDSKKGIQIKYIKQVICFAQFFEAEISPSCPFIILKGEIHSFRGAGEPTGCGGEPTGCGGANRLHAAFLVLEFYACGGDEV